MNLALRISLLLVMLVGCAGEIQRGQTTEPDVQKAKEEQKKPAMPTITYRPG
jgi:hypothetical protein